MVFVNNYSALWQALVPKNDTIMGEGLRENR